MGKVQKIAQGVLAPVVWYAIRKLSREGEVLKSPDGKIVLDKLLSVPPEQKFLGKHEGEDCFVKIVTDKDEFQTENLMRDVLPDHTNIVVPYSCWQDGDGYIVSKFVEGKTIADLLEAGPINKKKAIEIIANVCEGVKWSHEHGVVHRDIKPENVMVSASGAARLVDYGLAWSEKLEGKVVYTLSIGSFQYIDPIALLNHSKDLAVAKRADQYALGVLLYEMISGKVPYQDFEQVELAATVKPHLKPADIRAVSRVSDKLGEVIMESISHNIDKRPRNLDQYMDRVRDAS
jgi:eukaryotic-like serine/threonine-protein kinase